MERILQVLKASLAFSHREAESDVDKLDALVKELGDVLVGKVWTAEPVVPEPGLPVALGVQVHVVLSCVEDMRHTDLLQVFHVLHSFASTCDAVLWITF